MVYEDFLDGLAAGAYRCDLTACRLVDGRGNTFNGQGHLVWTASDGVHITLTTDGAEQLKKQFGKPVVPAGTIVPKDVFLTLSGKTMDQWNISISRLAPSGHDFHFDSPEVVWRFGGNQVLSDVEWTRELGIERHFVDFLLWPARLPMWPRFSETAYNNPRFARKVEARDWLECTCATGVIAARRISDDKVLVRAECKSQELGDGVVQASALAFSYLMGKATCVMGSQMVIGKQMRRVLPRFRVEPKDNDIAPPLGTGYELTGQFESFLQKAIEFFSTEQGAEVGNLLYACWDAADNTFTTQTIVVCTVVESLVNKLSAGEDIAAPLTDEQSEALKKAVIGMKFSDAFQKRLAGFLTNINAVNVKNLLNKWADESRLGITRADATAWSALRNATAHGHRLSGGDAAKRQEQVRNRARVESLINRLVLSMMKYEGRFHDTADWQFKPFPS